MTRSVTGPPALRLVVVAALLIFAVGVLGALAVGALDISWWPSLGSPLPSADQLPGR